MVVGFPQAKSPLRGLLGSLLAETGCLDCPPISWAVSFPGEQPGGDLVGILLRAGAGLDHLRPTRALMAPTRLLVPLPTALSGRVRTVTSPLTLVRQLRR